ncbi:MAG: MetQ/NlpA family ABC transporter substrate-binding protein, partial [Phascolarctobacterium sp.]|nr:MetQ/NlpA family ABC transporter substrate-binding protein [Phascolarctobacterium sp.]
MNKFMKYALIGAVSVFALAAVGCGGGGDKKAADNKPVIVGVNPGPHAQIMENVKKIAEKKGLKIEIKEFSDFVTPNSALAAGEIWANSYQHEPFLKATIKKEPSFKLVKAF